MCQPYIESATALSDCHKVQISLTIIKSTETILFSLFFIKKRGSTISCNGLVSIISATLEVEGTVC